MSIEEWLLATIKAIVTKPGQVRIECKTDETGNLYSVCSAPEDRGRIIGKKGSIAQALRIVLRAVGYAQDVRASLVIDAPGRKYEAPADEELGLRRPKFAPDFHDQRSKPQDDYGK